MLVRVALAAALLVALAVPATAQSPPTEDDRVAIQELLDRRARAVVERDRAAFMATVADVSPAFIARQQRFFSNLADVSLRSFRYTVVWDRYGDLVRPSDIERYPEADRVSIPVTEERYRIQGFDPEEAVEDIYFTFIEQDGEWSIAEDTDLDDLTLYSARHLWDFAALEAERSEHFVLYRHPCRGDCPADDHDYLDLAEQGLDRVDRYWTAPWRGRVVILVPATDEELSRMIQATFDLDNFVAFAYSTVDLSEGIDYTGHRILLNPDAFEGRSSATVLEIMAHELLHVATRNAAGPFIPIFVDEGFADYVGNDGDPAALAFFNSELSQGLFSGVLPEDFEFTVGSGTDVYRSYQESQSAVRFFVDRWGVDALVRFYRDLGRTRVAAGTVGYHLDRSLEKVTGLDRDEFERAWADSLGS